jgi:hypothetical protein
MFHSASFLLLCGLLSRGGLLFRDALNLLLGNGHHLNSLCAKKISMGGRLPKLHGWGNRKSWQPMNDIGLSHKLGKSAKRLIQSDV